MTALQKRGQVSDDPYVVSLAHRGLWAVADQRNSLAAFQGAFAHGWGVELDVRDLDGELVISHDPPVAGALPFSEVVDCYLAAGCPGALAVNVKADGLERMVADALRAVDPERWFAFDMSVPDTLRYVREGLPHFTRHSDVEPAPALYADADGVWLDDFAGGWIAEAAIEDHLAAGKRVAVVSPELHGRDHHDVWNEWRRWAVWSSPDVLLCTDLPTEAEEVFG
jgi:glycerophosphoryl diester phosphodiesterase